MRRLTMMALVLMWSVSTAHAAAIQVSSAAALGSNDFIDWGQLAEFSNPANGTVVTSNNGGTATIATPGEFTARVESSSWFGNFTPGDNLLSTDVSSFTINFTAPVAGLGAQIQGDAYGPFTASLQLFDSLLNPIFFTSGVSSGAQDGSAVFLGALSDAVNVASAVFTLTSSANPAIPGFAVNRLLLTDQPFQTTVPEPATLALLALGGAAAAFARRRRAQAL